MAGLGFNTSFSDLTGAATSILGGSNSVNQGGSGTAKSTSTQSTEISQEAVNKIIQDVLGGADGIASIFSGSQNAGMYNATSAAQASGNLAANLVGEIAKLMATQTTSTDSSQTSESEQKSDSGGLLKQIGSFF